MARPASCYFEVFVPNAELASRFYLIGKTEEDIKAVLVKKGYNLDYVTRIINRGGDWSQIIKENKERLG